MAWLHINAAAHASVLNKGYKGKRPQSRRLTASQRVEAWVLLSFTCNQNLWQKPYMRWHGTSTRATASGTEACARHVTPIYIRGTSKLEERALTAGRRGSLQQAKH
eukprot:1138446-Pelagomonas_calceolata.AAC.2